MILLFSLLIGNVIEITSAPDTGKEAVHEKNIYGSFALVAHGCTGNGKSDVPITYRFHPR